MEITDTLIVLTDYETLAEIYADELTRTRWGAVCNPMEVVPGKWCLPTGWKAELDKAEIDYTIEELTWTVEDVI